MIHLDKNADSILPDGLKDSPFGSVFQAIQAVAAEAFDTDPVTWRALIAWGFYISAGIDTLADGQNAAQFLRAALVSEGAPLVKATQTPRELAELLAMWRVYAPTFGQLEDLYRPYAVRADVRPITDAESQMILPVIDTARSFYVAIYDHDWSRPLTIAEAALIAERATPMGSRPRVYYRADTRLYLTVALAYGDVCAAIDASAIADYPLPPAPPGTLMLGPVVASLGAGTSAWLNSTRAQNTARRAYLLYRVLDSTATYPVANAVSLSENYGASNNSVRIQNNGADPLENFVVQYAEIEDACFVRSSQTFWAHTSKILSPGDSDYLYTYTTAIAQYGFGTEIYDPAEYSGFEILKAVRIDANGEHDVPTDGVLELDIQSRFSTVRNISASPVEYNYLIIKLIKAEPSDEIVFDMYFVDNGSSGVTFNANDYWFMCPVDGVLPQGLIDAGFSADSGRLKNYDMYYNPAKYQFSVEIFYGSVRPLGSEVAIDTSNFYVEAQGNGEVWIKSRSAFATPCYGARYRFKFLG